MSHYCDGFVGDRFTYFRPTGDALRTPIDIAQSALTLLSYIMSQMQTEHRLAMVAAYEQVAEAIAFGDHVTEPADSSTRMRTSL